MRDGMPVVALVVAAIALVVALSGLVSRGASEPEDAPEEAIQKAERRLDLIERQRQEMRKEMDEIAAKAARAIELGSVSTGAKVDTGDLEVRVKRAVESAMQARLAQEAARVGAAPAKATPEDKFTGMMQEAEKTLSFDADKAEALKSALTNLRGELNRVFRAHAGAERDRQAQIVRGRADAALRRVLSPAEFDKFDKWRKGTKDEYTKRFFGL